MATSALSSTAVRSSGLGDRISRVLMNPIVAASVTITVRLCLYFLLLGHSPLTSFLSTHIDRPCDANGTALYYTRESHEEMATPPHLHFSLWSPSTAPATWKDTLFWRDAIGARSTPAYLSSVMAWYTPYLPAALARQPTSGMWLCLCDALTALLVATWPSCKVGILYGFFVLNPVSVVATVFESLVAVEILLLCVALNAAHVRSRTATLAGLVACALLGTDFMALPVALLYPITARTMKTRLAMSALAATLVATATALYTYVSRHDARDAAIYVPPDNSPMWYVRESILAVFYRSLTAMYLQLPTVVSVLMLAYLPPFQRPNASASRGGAFQPLFPSARVAATLFALLFSLLCRGTATLPYWCVGVLFLYASLNPLASKPVLRSDGEVLVRSAWMRTRILVPIYAAAMSVPLEITFYGGWALRETSNPNWIFFAQIGFSAAGIMFVCVWCHELVNDLLEMEWVQKKLIKAKEGTTQPSVVTA